MSQANLTFMAGVVEGEAGQVLAVVPQDGQQLLAQHVAAPQLQPKKGKLSCIEVVGSKV